LEPVNVETFDVLLLEINDMIPEDDPLEVIIFEFVVLELLLLEIIPEVIPTYVV
jgi:hypothetical protein